MSWSELSVAAWPIRSAVVPSLTSVITLWSRLTLAGRSVVRSQYSGWIHDSKVVAGVVSRSIWLASFVVIRTAASGLGQRSSSRVWCTDRPEKDGFYYVNGGSPTMSLYRPGLFWKAQFNYTRECFPRWVARGTLCERSVIVEVDFSFANGVRVPGTTIHTLRTFVSKYWMPDWHLRVRVVVYAIAGEFFVRYCCWWCSWIGLFVPYPLTSLLTLSVHPPFHFCVVYSWCFVFFACPSNDES